jgi:Ca-activated chloride channel family protein
MMDTGLITSQGTDLAAAIQLALEYVKDDDEKFKVFVLVSDGEDHQGEAVALAEQARDLGIIIHTLGVGTPAGGPIPIYNEKGNRYEFKKNIGGHVITSMLNESTLDEIARITGGIYIRVENQVNAIAPLLKEIDQMEKRELKSHVFSQYEDRYQIFLIVGLLLFLVEFLIPTRTEKEMIWEGRFTKN